MDSISCVLKERAQVVVVQPGCRHARSSVVSPRGRHHLATVRSLLCYVADSFLTRRTLHAYVYYTYDMEVVQYLRLLRELPATRMGWG